MRFIAAPGIESPNMRRDNETLKRTNGERMGTSSAQGPTRRSFLRYAGAGMALIPLVNLAGCSPADDPGPERRPATQPDPQRLTPEEQVPPSAPPESPAPTPPESTRQLVYLDENDPDAQALAYTHDAANVDREAQPRYAPGQVCANCSLYQTRLGGEVQVETGAEPVSEVPGWGGCTIFPGRLVNAAGWCSAWVPRA
jgi:hypothetical protein